MMSKSLLNDSTTCVDDYLSGLTAMHSGLIQLPNHRVVLRKDLHLLKGKVALLSGGGAGHEPAYAGFVGKGMLSGAVIGALFTSPPPMSIFAAIKAVNRFEPNGIILIVANYTGDRLNFGLAMEWANNQNIKVKMVVVDDDCALTSADHSAGRRGLCGTLLVHKIAGALSEQMASMDFILTILKEVIDNMGTISICLSPCTIPGEQNAAFELKQSEMELGVGVHGEAGIQRVQLATCSETIEMMLHHMTNPHSANHLPLNEKDEIVVVVNNLGGTSNLELGVLTNEVIKALKKRSVLIKRVYSGTFMTSLQMVGISLTILKLAEKRNSIFSLLSLLDMKTEVAAPLVNVVKDENEANSQNIAEFDDSSSFCSSLVARGPKVDAEMASVLKKCVISSCDQLIAMQEKLNEFDRGSGDGDCGSTHARGATKILQALQKEEDFEYPAELLQRIGQLCSEHMGGSSGAMYSILFTAMARPLSKSQNFNLKEFALAVKEGVESVERHGRAKVGDRTMVDVLKPIAIELTSTTETNAVIVAKYVSEVAEKAAQGTLSMKAKAGRASYVNQDQLKDPDPGATAVATVVSAISEVLQLAL